MENKNLNVRVRFNEKEKINHGVVVAEYSGVVTILCDEDGVYYSRSIDEVEALTDDGDMMQMYSEEIKVCLEALELIIKCTQKKDISMATIREVIADTRLKLLGKDEFITKP
jgi:hypothetical protein